MAVNVKMGVDLGGFKSGIQEGQNILKGLNAEMKATEAEFKATGNAEKALEQKTKTLTSQLNVQKAIADQAAAALKKMEEHGVKPTDAAYQKMYVTMMNARAGMNNAQEGLNNLHGQQEKTKKSAEELKDELNGIGKKISLDQVLSGINSITTGLENAAKKAVQLGEEIWNSIMSSARWADDTATMAQMYGIDVEQFQRMQKLVTNGLDTSVEAILKSQSKLKKGIGSGSKDVAAALEEIGVALTETVGNGKYGAVEQARDSLEVFWEAGQKIMSLGDEYRQEDMAQKLFGRSWHELVPLFESYKTVEEYQKALEGVQIVSEESVEAGAALNDKVSELEGNFQTLKNSVLLSMAPALSEVADSLNKVLGSVLDYLQTDDGQRMLKSLGDAVASLFEDVKNIDADSAIEMIKGAFGSIQTALEWIKNNKDNIVTALQVIAGGFAALKLGEIALNVWKFVDGARTLLGLGKGAGTKGASASATAGATSGITGTGMSMASKFGALSLTGAMMVAPAIIAGMARKLIPDEYKLESDAFVKNSQYTTDELKDVRDYADTLNEIHQMEEQMFNDDFDQARYEALSAKRDELAHVTDTELFRNFWLNYVQNQNEKGDLFDLSVLDDMIKAVEGEGGVPVEVAPQVKEGAAADLSAQVGTVPITAQLVLNNPNAGYTGGGGGGLRWIAQTHANGLPFVPYDGYLAMLHRGERVLTARANRSYTFNSNNYFGNVNLNNGHDIDELCTSIDRHNRRMQSGFGA